MTLHAVVDAVVKCARGATRRAPLIAVSGIEIATPLSVALWVVPLALR